MSVNELRDNTSGILASQASAENEATEPETEQETGNARRNWREYKGVVEATPIDTVDRLTIYVGVNEYKGNHLIFVAKVTDKDFQRSFFSMPAYVWEKAIPVLQNYVKRIGEIEKKAMAEAVLKELKRLQELGIDVKSLINQL